MPINKQTLQTNFAPFVRKARQGLQTAVGAQTNLQRQGVQPVGKGTRQAIHGYGDILSQGFGQALQSTEQQRQFDISQANYLKALDDQHDADTLSGIGSVIGMGGDILDMVSGGKSLMDIFGKKKTGDAVAGVGTEVIGGAGSNLAVGGAGLGTAGTVSGGVAGGGVGAGSLGTQGAGSYLATSGAGTGATAVGGSSAGGAAATGMNPSVMAAGQVVAPLIMAGIAYKVYEGFKKHGEKNAVSLLNIYHASTGNIPAKDLRDIQKFYPEVDTPEKAKQLADQLAQKAPLLFSQESLRRAASADLGSHDAYAGPDSGGYQPQKPEDYSDARKKFMAGEMTYDEYRKSLDGDNTMAFNKLTNLSGGGFTQALPTAPPNTAQRYNGLLGRA